MLDKAIKIVSDAFLGECDKQGEPYILHCLYVMFAVQHLGQHAMIVAVLHDLLEDHPEDWTEERLLQEGFDPHDVDLVVMLTRKVYEDYFEDYIKRVATHPITREIKKADLKHNSDPSRSKGLTEKDEKRIIKYHKAYAYLKSV